MEAWLGLAKAALWPAFAVFAVFFFRRSAQRLIDVLAQKVADAGKLKMHAAGVGFELAAQVVRATAVPDTRKTGASTESEADEFERLATEYVELRIADYAERVAQRRKLADRLATLANKLKKSRSTLAAGNEGHRVALATAVVLEPREKDLGALVTASEQPGLFRFTAYRIVLALFPVLSRPRLSKAVLNQADSLVDNVEKTASADGDTTLRQLIDDVRRAIDTVRAERGLS